MDFWCLAEQKNENAGEIGVGYKEHIYTEELLEHHYTDGGKDAMTRYYVFKGTWTPYLSVRDCGDHYIYAGYSSYTRIDKGTFAVTRNVEDK